MQQVEQRKECRCRTLTSNSLTTGGARDDRGGHRNRASENIFMILLAMSTVVNTRLSRASLGGPSSRARSSQCEEVFSSYNFRSHLFPPVSAGSKGPSQPMYAFLQGASG